MHEYSYQCNGYSEFSDCSIVVNRDTSGAPMHEYSYQCNGYSQFSDCSIVISLLLKKASGEAFLSYSGQKINLFVVT